MSTLTPPTHLPLQLTRVRVLQLRLTLQRPFITSFGRQSIRDTLLIILETSDGLQGFGETPSLIAPMYDEQYVWADLDVLRRFLIPSLQTDLNGTLHRVTDIERAFRSVKGHHFAKCGLEAAYWHLVTQQQAISWASLWGGTTDRVVAGFSIGAQNLDDVLTRAKEAITAGFKRLKVKIWPGFDMAVMKALREKYPDVLLQADANAAYDPFDTIHVSALKALDDFGLLLIEQPFLPNRVLDHVRFQAQHDLKTPICLDESILNLDDARQAIELWQMFDIADRLIINVKPPRVGGFWESVKIASYSQAHQVACWVGGMLETGLGKWMNISLAAHPAFTLPGDHLQPQPYYERDITIPLPSITSDGTILLPDHDLIQIDWEAIKALQVDAFEFRLD